MTYPEYSYSELVMGGYKGKPRNNVLDAKEFNSALKGNTKAGCYRNMFRFTKDYQDYVRDTGSVKGYAGPCYSDFFWLDIDKKDDLPGALEIARIYLNRLALEYDIPCEHLRTYFSGMKGFHIGIPMEVFGVEPCVEFPGICKELAVKLAGDLDYDPSVYDRVRLFRLTNTKHEESGLLKVQLSSWEILNSQVSGIQEWARHPRTLEIDSTPEDSHGTLAHLVEVPVEKEEAPRKQEKSENWITDLLDNGAKNGRVNAVVRLAGYYKKKKFPEDVTLETLSIWDYAKNVPSLQEDEPGELERAVKNIYAMPGENGGATEGADEDTSIQYHNCISVHAGAAAYVEKFSRNRLKFGYSGIDDHSALLGRGEVANIIAYTGVGKTALVQCIQMYVSGEQGVPSMMFALEMSAMRLYFRQLGIQWKMSSKEVEAVFMAGDGDSLVNGSTDKYKDMFVVDHVPLSVPLMADCVRQSPVEIGLVIVDHVGLMQCDERGEYEIMGALSRDLVLMAKELHVAVIAVYQTRRPDHGSNEITLGMGRGSGMIEANCDITLGFWEDEKDSTHRHLKLLKARHGQSGANVELRFDGTSPKLIAY